MDTGTNPKVSFIVELVKAFKRAGAYKPGSPLDTDICSSVVSALRSAATGDNEVYLEMTEHGAMFDDELLSFETPGVAALVGHLLNRHTRAVIVPRKVPIDDTWRFLVILGGPPEEIEKAGGPVSALADAGVFTIRVEEEPVTAELRVHPPSTDAEINDDDTSGWSQLSDDVESLPGTPRDSEPKGRKLPSVTGAFGLGNETMTREFVPQEAEDNAEEITPWQSVSDEIESHMGENTKGAIVGGDTIKTGLDQASGEFEMTVLDRITRQIIRSQRPKGADEAAVGLLTAWRRIFKFENESETLPDRPVAGTLQRLDPLLRFFILARLSGSAEGRAVSALIPDSRIAEALADAVTSATGNIEKPALALLRTVRPRGALQIALINEVGIMLEARGDQEKVDIWNAIRQSLSETQ